MSPSPLTSRERVRRAIHFEGPDRLPHFLPDGGPNDLAWIWPSRPPPREPWHIGADGLERCIDLWGSLIARPKGWTNHGEKIRVALDDVARQDGYALPAFNTPAAYAAVAPKIAEAHAGDNPLYVLGVLNQASMFESAHHILGLPGLLAAYYEEPQALQALLARLAAAARESIERLAELGCDGVMFYDDWGLQDRTMIGMNLLEEFHLPHYRGLWGLARRRGLDVWMHSCGYTLPFLPAFIEAGLTVAQLDQQQNMGLEALDRAVGGRLAFWSPADTQGVMAGGTPEEVRAYVFEMRRTLGGHRGGLVSMAYSSPEAVGHAPENTRAMCQAFRDCERYPAATP